MFFIYPINHSQTKYLSIIPYFADLIILRQRHMQERSDVYIYLKIIVKGIKRLYNQEG
jgi:hypothetical protein